MITIQNIPEARQELANVKETVAALETFLIRLERMFSGQVTNQPVAQPAVGRNGGTPIESVPFIDRVTKILKEVGKPMKPKEITEEYRKRGWPIPERGELYNNISGALGYLISPRKRAIARTDEGYVIAETQ